MDDHFLRRQEERKRQERLKRAKRKNMIIYIETLVIFVLMVALVVVSINYVSLKGEITDIPPESTVSGSFSGPAVDTSSSDALKAELDKWYMKLVNPDNAVDRNFISSVDRGEINSRYTSGSESSKTLDKRVIEYFENMCKDAANDGITLISISSYRTYAYQEGLYKNRVQRCINEGLSRSEAEKKAATIVALPGTSEHHLGLAVDINSVEESFENTSAFRWLKENAENYGFILRYPKDKQGITKIIYEPWHYRFVGVEHAKAMNDLGMCFEEYVDYLKNGGVR